MRKTGVLVVVGVLAGASQIQAQDRVAAVAQAVSVGRYVEPTCDLKTGHFLVSSAATYLSSGSGQGDRVKAAGLYEKGIETATKAIVENDQASNGAAWYFLGRNYLAVGDLAGADSAFTRAATLIPECTEDMKVWRQRAWFPLGSKGQEYVQAGQSDSALMLFRQANSISRAVPIGYYNMGVIFANAGQTDSSIHYFKRAKEVAESDLKLFTKDRNAAAFNLAAMYQRNDQHEEAVTELQRYITWVPADEDAKRALASSLRTLGRTDEAAALEKELLASAEAAGTLSQGDIMAMGINAFNEKKFDEAAASFQRVLEQEPQNHDAMYNLANAYLALENGEKLLPVAAQLIEREPLSDEDHRLLAQAYRMTSQEDSLIAVVTRLLALPTAVQITSFAPRPASAMIAGTATGRAAQVDGAEIPAAPRTLVVEFLAADGTVIDSKEVEIPALPAGQTFDWSAEGSGDGIAAWRYRVK